METRISNKLYIKNPTKDVINYSKSLVLNNPEYENKKRMGKWIGNTPKKLYLFEEKGDALVLPFGCIDDIGKLLIKDEYTTTFAENEPITMQGNINLFDYQEVALQKMLKAKNGVLISPAGSGKTQIGISLIKSLGKKALWVTHTNDLLRQSLDRAKDYFDGDFGVIAAGKVSIGADITFATVQTLSNLDLTQYQDEWDVIIADEVHHLAGTPTMVMMFYKIFSHLRARYKYGITATLHRADGLERCVTATIGNVIYTVPDSSVKDRIVKPAVKKISTGVPMSLAILDTDGTLKYNELLKYLIGHKDRIKIIVDVLKGNPNNSNLILSARVAHLKEMMEMLDSDDAVMIDGSMTTKKAKIARQQAIEDMRTGKKKYLFATYSLAKEGLDIPRLNRLYLTTPQKDKAVVIQSVGRISRVFDGKEHPLCYDFVDDIGYCQGVFKKRKTIYRKLGLTIDES